MTDHELSKAVADACGIEVKEHAGFLWLTNGTEFTPATSWNSAMLAAEKCGLFDDYFTELSKDAGGWKVEVLSVGKWISTSGPRAICEAILAVAKEAG